MSRDEVVKLLTQQMSEDDGYSEMILHILDAAGLVIVPREPTELMGDAGAAEIDRNDSACMSAFNGALLAYRAMLEASAK